MTKRSHGARLNSSQRSFLWIFGVPTLMVYCFVCIVPLFCAVHDSFTDWMGIAGTPKTPVGFANYLEIFRDPVFYTALKNDLVISFFKLVLITALALLFAVALTRSSLSNMEKKIYRYMLYLPTVLPIVVITIVWKLVFEQSGALNSLILSLSGREQEVVMNMTSWIAENPVTVISFVAIWCGTGYSMIVLIAAINNIPNELYEAATLDGAGEWKQFTHVTLPGILGQVRYVMVYIVSSTLASNLNLVLPLTNGQPGNTSTVMGLYVYKYGLTAENGISRVGYANAAAVILMIVSFLLCYSLNRMISGKEEKR